MKNETVPPYKETECKTCKAKDVPLFLLQPARSSDDFFCEKHRKEEYEKRAKECVANG